MVSFSRTPELRFTGDINLPKLPTTIYIGEAAGVATDSKGNIFVNTRTSESATMGGSRFFIHGGSRLLEFDRSGKFVRELATGVYGFLFAQSVRVDAQDNVWAVDRGSRKVPQAEAAGAAEARRDKAYKTTISTAPPISPGARRATCSYRTPTPMPAS